MEIHEVGLPVAKEFEEIAQVEPASLRREQGLDQDLPIVLIMTGGVGWGDVDDILRGMPPILPGMETGPGIGRNRRPRCHSCQGEVC